MARCDTYYLGECTWGACEYAGWVPEALGNATDWVVNAQAQGLAVTDVPTVGAVVVYAAGDGYSTFGHCGVVIDVGQGGQFLVHEMNFSAYDQYDDRWSSSYDVEGFILPPGVAPGAGGTAPGRGGPGPQLDVQAKWGQWQDYINHGIQDQFNQRAATKALVDQVT